ncbi:MULTISPECIES: Sec-independent protein translocase protein TatB [Marinobacter]|uniref:Sec-independent protein translocase protein TatB n=1 Tax=Marinobacter suaedae TaxID=3057675 RepID=A0ABT8VYH8_9GAMM|nr:MULTISPECIES: Sec-independent protein translocase protein TatB [unclassified Marinobacter]MDO3720983.1 Sec-independent protein translocase protein TatB [Marinobacter sp. chi1]
MFDIGFLELIICAVIALLILGPERLPTAARAAGRWVGAARRMVGQFTSELDRQLKADELREELRKAGDVGLGDVQKTVRDALNEAKQYEHMILPDSEIEAPSSAPATRRTSGETPENPLAPPASQGTPSPDTSKPSEPAKEPSAGRKSGSSDKHS